MGTYWSLLYIKYKQVNIIQLLTGYEGNTWFVGSEDTNVAQGHKGNIFVWRSKQIKLPKAQSTTVL